MPVRRGTGLKALLGPAVLAGLGVSVVCMVTGVALAGLEGLAAAALGTALVLGFLLLGQLPVLAAARGQVGLGAVLLLGGYGAMVLALLAVFVVVTLADAPDPRVLGASVIAVALGWTAGTVWSWLHWRPAVVDVELPTSSEPSER